MNQLKNVWMKHVENHIGMDVAFEIGLNMSFEPNVHTGFYACGKPFDAHSKPRENGLSMTIIQMCIYLNVRVC